MPTTWSTADTSWTLATYTFAEFSLAYELGVGGRITRGLKRDKYGRVINGPYAAFFKDPVKKRRVIQLIMKVKSNKIKQKVEIPTDTEIALSDIDMVIKEVLSKPPVVNINVA